MISNRRKIILFFFCIITIKVQVLTSLKKIIIIIKAQDEISPP